MKILKSATILGYDARVVDVELSSFKALPSFSIVGLPNSSIQESKERVKSSLNFCDFKFPSLKIVVNLSPSDVLKDGTHFDLAIAVLIYLYDKDLTKNKLDDYFVFGELSLNGDVKESSKAFSLILSLWQNSNISKVIVPRSLQDKLSIIPNLEIYTCEKLQDVVDFFLDKKTLPVYKTEDFDFLNITINNKKYFYQSIFELDFKDVKGQEIAKRAALISVCGFHNILLEGSPGCGKSMIAKRMQYVLPPSSIEEILQKVKIQSLDNENTTINALRAFRSPHNSSTPSSVFGGGSKNARVGEIALANNGILFFDELPHFSKQILESMREPLEDHKVLISRVNYKIQYQANFLFVCAMNPCPCGNLLSTSLDCRCSDIEIQRYKNKLSDPFKDRIDLYVQMQPTNANDKSSITSLDIQNTMIKTFKRQIARQGILNSRILDSDIEKYCPISDEANEILNKASVSFSLSFRSIKKIIKIARTISDIKEIDIIDKDSVMEALSYRHRK